ncbi:hypothetical protein GB864_13685, partial [Agromyces sp. MMS17-SY077]|nr:hypothetical protein [Agromyces seonyuensis]
MSDSGDEQRRQGDDEPGLEPEATADGTGDQAPVEPDAPVDAPEPVAPGPDPVAADAPATDAAAAET